MFYYSGEPINTKEIFFCLPVLTFNMMESASGVKGMFILVTTGALGWLVRRLSPNVARKWMWLRQFHAGILTDLMKSWMRLQAQLSVHWGKHFHMVHNWNIMVQYCLFTSPLVKGGKETSGCYNGNRGDSTGEAKILRSFVGFWLQRFISGLSGSVLCL